MLAGNDFDSILLHQLKVFYVLKTTQPRNGTTFCDKTLNKIGKYSNRFFKI